MVREVNQHRRQVLKGTISASTMALVAASGLLLPQRLLAHWPKNSFNAETVEDALLTLLGEADVAEDPAISFKVGTPPSYAVNGASVPVQIQSDLENIERIVVLVEKNPFPLAMSLDVTEAVKLPFKTMIKIREDSNVMAIIRANGKLYKTSRFVEVDIGGCG
ncbi:transcriptional initiation protein Tat [Pseudomonadota bacterium]|nr:transcriptional initiation protein Tat [Pseudomonadota bacterium]